jgi:hypothetical protein
MSSGFHLASDLDIFLIYPFAAALPADCGRKALTSDAEFPAKYRADASMSFEVRRFGRAGSEFS